MKLIVDEREKQVYENITQPFPSNIEVVKQVLPLGDFLVTEDDDTPVLLCERKSFSDLFASIKDGRYEEQSYRLSNDSRFPNKKNIVYVIEGVYSQLPSASQKKLLVSTITSLFYFKGFTVLRTTSPLDTADTLLHMIDKIARDYAKGKKPWPGIIPNPPAMDGGDVSDIPEILGGHEPTPSTPVAYSHVVKAVKKDNINRDNIGVIMLSQVPGISATTAEAIMREADNSMGVLINILETDPDRLYSLKVGEKKRKLSKKIIETMIGLLCGCKN